MNMAAPTDIDPGALKDEIQAALSQVEDLLRLPEKHERAIEAWERLWNDRLPDIADEARGMVAALEEMDSFSPETAEQMGEVFQLLAKCIDMASSDKAPNPDIVALYYLRRQDKMLVEICNALSDSSAIPARIDLERLLG